MLQCVNLKKSAVIFALFHGDFYLDQLMGRRHGAVVIKGWRSRMIPTNSKHQEQEHISHLSA